MRSRAFDQRTNEPVVTFRFDPRGRRALRPTSTQQNVGRLFAIILDNQVISAPRIREPILGGTGPDLGQLHRPVAPTTSPCCCAPARCRPT